VVALNADAAALQDFEAATLAAGGSSEVIRVTQSSPGPVTVTLD
jgi:hypothetical protein